MNRVHVPVVSSARRMYLGTPPPSGQVHVPIFSPGQVHVPTRMGAVATAKTGLSALEFRRRHLAAPGSPGARGAGLWQPLLRKRLECPDSHSHAPLRCVQGGVAHIFTSVCTSAPEWLCFMCAGLVGLERLVAGLPSGRGQPAGALVVVGRIHRAVLGLRGGGRAGQEAIEERLVVALHPPRPESRVRACLGERLGRRKAELAVLCFASVLAAFGPERDSLLLPGARAADTSGFGEAAEHDPQPRHPSGLHRSASRSETGSLAPASGAP